MVTLCSSEPGQGRSTNLRHARGPTAPLPQRLHSRRVKEATAPLRRGTGPTSHRRSWPPTGGPPGARGGGPSPVFGSRLAGGTRLTNAGTVPSPPQATPRTAGQLAALHGRNAALGGAQGFPPPRAPVRQGTWRTGSVGGLIGQHVDNTVGPPIQPPDSSGLSLRGLEVRRHPTNNSLGGLSPAPQVSVFPVEIALAHPRRNGAHAVHHIAAIGHHQATAKAPRVLAGPKRSTQLGSGNKSVGQCNDPAGSTRRRPRTKRRPKRPYEGPGPCCAQRCRLSSRYRSGPCRAEVRDTPPRPQPKRLLPGPAAPDR